MVELCTDISKCTFKNWDERSINRVDWEKSIKERRSVLDCSAIEEEEEDVLLILRAVVNVS